ncbi:WD-repeat-containing protein [Clavulina sp. PMI_390]|nr:WD-repeat-containing protein [Clavulina sp. PMI_390]
MVRSYLRHGETKAFGLVCSASSNSLYDGRLAYVPALEDILVWDVKKSQMVGMWHETGHRSEVTCMAQSPRKDTFAIGYADGSVRLWSAESSTVIVAFNGHKKSVTALAFDDTGARLASGSQDTELIVWDVLAETGLFRLRGHRDQITALKFLTSSSTTESAPSTSTSTSAASGYLLTSSKDTLLKLWDLSIQHCVQTVVAHRSEIWSMATDPIGKDLIFTGSGDGELKAWRIDYEALGKGVQETETGELAKMIHPLASLPLSARSRVSQIAFHPTASYLAVQSHDRSVELFRVRTEEEVRKKQARRKKREKEKKDKKGKSKEADEEVEPEAEGEMEKDVTLEDLFTPYLVVRGSGKVKSFSFVDEEANAKGEVQLMLALTTNALEVYKIPSPQVTKKEKSTPEPARLYGVDMPGHRTDIRAVAVSSDDQILASASNGQLKIWNLRTTACIRTMDCGYAICCSFLPGDRHVVVGTKSGELQVFDIAASTMTESIEAHSGSVWSVHVRPDGAALVTGSADKDIKFWELEQKVVEGKQQLALVHVKTLKMSDDVLAVKYSPDGRLLAVALLDSTVKVFYADSLKFFLSLYGHKLPVLSLDISTDSKLIATVSADKNIKIWGLDFGDCHKSIFAHDESIMQVAFEREIDRMKAPGEKGAHSHYIWTVGKDKMLKYWDGDKFENIQKLNGHHGEIWALAVSNNGKFVITGSHDKSLRVWEKTEEPLFLEEEREKELEALYESGVADSLNRTDAAIGSGIEGAEEQALIESGAVTKQTADTLMAGERIVEALDLADRERALFRAYDEECAESQDPAGIPPPARNPLLAALNLTPEEHVLRTVEKVRAAELFDALLVLPFSKVLSMISYLNEWALREWSIILVSRIMFFLLKTHHHQIVATRSVRPVLVQLRTRLRNALRRQKDEIGYNVAGLRFIRRTQEARTTADFYAEAQLDESVVREKLAGLEKKRKRVSLRG